LGGAEVVITETINISSYFKVNIFFPVLDIITNDIKTKIEENYLKVLNALQTCLSSKICGDKIILEVFDTYDLKEDNLKAKLKIFGKMCLSNNVFKSFENHLKFVLTENSMDSFENMYKVFKIYFINSYEFCF